MTLFDQNNPEFLPEKPHVLDTNVNDITDQYQTFFNATNGSFNTPKKINRTPILIPEEYCDKIDNSTITSEDIVRLGSLVTLFRYKTCVTIHGLWRSTNERIGGYKNVHVNKNGSIELKYNAIDRDKKDALAKLCRIVGWAERRDSEGDCIFKQYSFSDKQLALAKIAELKNLYSNSYIDGITSIMNIGGYAVWGVYIVRIEFKILSIISDNINYLVSGITKIPETDIQLAIDNIKAKESQELEKKENQRLFKEKIEAELRSRYVRASVLRPSSIYVSYSGRPELPYTFFHTGPSGSFGRYELCYNVLGSCDQIPDTFPMGKKKKYNLSDFGERVLFEVRVINTVSVANIKSSKVGNDGLVARVIYNTKGGIDISFSSRPSDDIISELKRAGFKWSARHGHWWAYKNDNTLAVAKKYEG